jgi:transporter family protein
MDAKTIFVFVITFVGWGLGTFFGKLATNRIGEKAVFWDIFGYALAVIIYCFMAFKSSELFNVEKSGMIWGILAGLFGAVGLVGFYILLAKNEASTIIPMTALYPVLAVVLGIIVLHEGVTLTKVIGIILSLVAIYLLNK